MKLILNQQKELAETEVEIRHAEMDAQIENQHATPYGLRLRNEEQ